MAVQYALTIGEFAKTIEGKRTILEQQPFAINGKAYQGFQGTVIDIRIQQLNEETLARMTDVDGTSIEMIRQNMERRSVGRRMMKDRELKERDDERCKRETDRLHNRVLRAQLNEMEQDDNDLAPEDEIAALKQRLATLEGKGPDQARKCVCGAGPFASVSALTNHKKKCEK